MGVVQGKLREVFPKLSGKQIEQMAMIANDDNMVVLNGFVK